VGKETVIPNKKKNKGVHTIKNTLSLAAVDSTEMYWTENETEVADMILPTLKKRKSSLKAKIPTKPSLLTGTYRTKMLLISHKNV